MMLVNYINGQPDNQNELQNIETWWQNLNGKTPRIIENEGNLTDCHSNTVSTNSPVTNVSINGDTVAWTEGGKSKTVKVTSIVLDQENNNLKFSLASNQSINLEFQY